jgi:hypothetical protein
MNWNKTKASDDSKKNIEGLIQSLSLLKKTTNQNIPTIKKCEMNGYSLRTSCLTTPLTWKLIIHTLI